MENKSNNRRLGKRRLYLAKQKHMVEVIKARRREASENPEIQSSLAAARDPTQPSVSGSKEDAPLPSFKAWVAAATNQPEVEPSTSSQVSHPLSALTPQATSSSFRDWISAQSATSSGNQVSVSNVNSNLVMTIEPLQPTIRQDPPALMESTESEYIVLAEPETLDTVKKETCDKPSDITDETDILASCSSSQLDNIQLEPCTTAESSTKLNEIKVYLKPNIKTRTTKRNINPKTYSESKPKSKPKSASTTKGGRPLGTKKLRSVQTMDPNTESLLVPRVPRGRSLKKQCHCQTKELKDASTSTDDLIRVKEERNESEELRLFFELCDKYLDETTAEVAKLRASANSESSWLIVTEP